MTNKDFNKIVEYRIKMIRSVLSKKAVEYAHGDRLSNFNRAAAMLGQNREKALMGMLAKHLVSILDIIDEFDTKKPKEELINEKIGDFVNYAILLEAMMKEDISKTKKATN